jgi:3-hydroxybutyryl-CoA dehydrogenase
VDIGTVGVVGAGVMGSEIGFAAATAGLDVVLVDVDDAAVGRGLAHVQGICDRRVARGRLTAAEAAAIVGRVGGSTAVDALGRCEAVVEAVPEILALKRELWRSIDAHAPAGALLASNTSGLSISALAAETRRPGDVLGLHFFNPASVMRLVEVIRGQETTPATLARGEDLARRLGKTPVAVVECPGFLVNRILVRALAEAYRRADEIGADPASADRAVVDGGPAPMGPFALGDLIGLDTVLHVQRDLERAYGDRFAAGTSLAARVAAGDLGQKSGAGFVHGRDATAGDAHGPDVAERYLLGAVDEACRCLEDGIAALPDIDTAMRAGAGWEAGPLAWADALGLDAVHARLASAAGAEERFAPRPALRDRIAAGTTFTTDRKEEA